MVKITNGVDVFEVTNGAFEGIYSKQGYTKVEEEAPKKKVAPKNDDEKTQLSDDEKFCAELLEKPIGQWNKDEVKRFAELKEIDITGTKNANEAKDRIKAFLEISTEE